MRDKIKSLDLSEVVVQGGAMKKRVDWPVNKPIPHMMDVGGTLVEGMPRAHPTMRVQLKVDVGTYKKLGIPLMLGRSFMSKKGRLFQTPKLELLCDTGAQVDCISRRNLRLLGLGEDQLRKPQVTLDCANKTEAEVLSVFFGEVSPMEGDWSMNKVKILFYVMKQGGDMISRHTCERSGLIDKELSSRPKRDRKQNVRYSSQEYDLSTVSLKPGTAKLKLSSICVQPKSGKLKKKMINRRV